MRRFLRPATLVLAAALVTLSACSSSPTAPASEKKIAPAVAAHDDDNSPADTTHRTGTTQTGG